MSRQLGTFALTYGDASGETDIESIRTFEGTKTIQTLIVAGNLA